MWKCTGPSGPVQAAIAFLCIVVLIVLVGVVNQDSPTAASWRGSSRPLDAAASSRFYNSVTNATLGFQKIFVINLPSRTDNRDAMSLAASVTGIEVEYIDGVTNFDANSLPPHPEGGPYMEDGQPLSPNNLGSWRAHMNAIRAIVEQNLTSALILEDDGDWDVRIKSQLIDFARMSRLLVQPLAGTTDQFLDPTNPRKSEQDVATNIEADERQPAIQEAISSPYGDINNWDMLWMGHCGTHFASPEQTPGIPLGRVVMRNDPTTPPRDQIEPGYGDSGLADEYPEHTRVVAWTRGTICNTAYGVSLPGARKFLYEMGVANMTTTTDGMLMRICEGDRGRPRHTCVGVRPPLFSQHFWRDFDAPFTLNIRYSTVMNLKKLVWGQTDYDDQFPDD